LLLGSAAGLVVWYPTTSRAIVEFDWTDWSDASVTMFVTFAANGIMAQGNAIWAETAALYATSQTNFTGPASILIRGDANFSRGDIEFVMSRPTSTQTYFHSSNTFDEPPSGQVTPYASGRLGLFAHIKVDLNNEERQAWSQYTGAANFTPESWIPISPASENFAGIGLRVAAASILVAAAVSAPGAIESLRNLKRIP